jgi:DNA-binding SARP family transcriptional activator/TolB-like protein/Flp pilus assembly protein TadD
MGYRLAHEAIKRSPRRQSRMTNSDMPSRDGPERARSNIGLRLTLFGRMQVHTGAQEPLTLPGRKSGAMLGVLALTPSGTVHRSTMAKLLWSTRSQEQARASLRQEIHRLLEALEPIGVSLIKVDRDYVRLPPEVVSSDVHDVMRANAEEPFSLQQMQGQLLEGTDGLDPALDVWLVLERSKVRDHARAVLEAVLAKERALDAVIAVANKLVAVDPSNETACRALIRAYAERGDRSRAIQAYEQCSKALLAGMDAVPGVETQRLVADLRAGDIYRLASSGPRSAALARLPGGHSVLVGVLSFMPIGMVPDRSYLGLSLAEGLAIALAQNRWLSLVSPSSLAHFGEEEARLRETSGMDYVLAGSVQQTGIGIRMSLRLLDLRNENTMVWSQHFDGRTHELYGFEDEIVSSAAAQIGPEIERSETRRETSYANQQSSEEDATAYGLVMRAMPMTTRLRRAEFDKAEAMLRRALDLEPDYAPAHCSLAYHLAFRYVQGWTANKAHVVEEAGRCANRAVALAPQSARAFSILGQIRTLLHRQPQEGLELHMRALSLNPSLAVAYGSASTSYAYMGDVENAVHMLARYRELSRNDPDAFIFETAAVLVELGNRNYLEAATVGRRATELCPNFALGLRHSLVALGHLEAHAPAEAILQRLLAIQPGANVQCAIRHMPYTQAADTEHYAQGLRLAGLPEGEP